MVESLYLCHHRGYSIFVLFCALIVEMVRLLFVFCPRRNFTNGGKTTPTLVGGITVLQSMRELCNWALLLQFHGRSNCERKSIIIVNFYYDKCIAIHVTVQASLSHRDRESNPSFASSLGERLKTAKVLHANVSTVQHDLLFE